MAAAGTEETTTSTVWVMAVRAVPAAWAGMAWGHSTGAMVGTAVMGETAAVTTAVMAGPGDEEATVRTPRCPRRAAAAAEVGTEARAVTGQSDPMAATEAEEEMATREVPVQGRGARGELGGMEVLAGMAARRP